MQSINKDVRLVGDRNSIQCYINFPSGTIVFTLQESYAFKPTCSDFDEWVEDIKDLTKAMLVIYLKSLERYSVVMSY